jgi:WD40 repeat protein
MDGDGDRVSTLAFSPDGKRLAAAGGSGVVRFYDAAGKEPTPAAEPAGPVVGLSAAPDGPTLAVVRGMARLSLWDCKTGREARPPAVRLPEQVTGAAFRPGDGALATVTAHGRFQLWDLKTGKDLAAEPDPAAEGTGGTIVPVLAFTADGKAAATCPLYRGVRLWGGKGEYVRTVQEGGERYLCAAFSPDGKTLAAGGPAAAVRLWDVEHKDATRELPGHPGGGVLGLAFSPDGATLASVGKDCFLRFWDVKSGKEQRTPGGHPAWVRCVAFSPDGRFLATGADDGLVRLWSAAGRLLHELPGHRGDVTALAFADRGAVLLSGGQDTTVLAWDAAALLRDDRPAPIKLTDEELEKHWKALAGEDPAAAGVAEQALARAAAQALPRLRDRVRPAAEKQVAKLIKDLDDDDFPTRAAAQKELARLGKAVEPALREALKGQPSAEVRQQVRALLDKLSAASDPDWTQTLRAVEVLEMIGGDEAEQALREAAKGPDGLELTARARAALERMKKP